MSGPQKYVSKLTERDEKDRALKSGAQKKAYNVEETRKYIQKKKEEYKEEKLRIETEKRKALEEKKMICALCIPKLDL